MLFDLTRAHLEGVRLEAPVEGLRLRIERMESGGTPLSLFSTQDPDAEAVELALARIEAALGEGAVLRAFSVDGYRPEKRVVYDHFSASMMTERHTKRDAKPKLPKPTMQLRTFEPRAIDLVMQAGVPRFAGTPPQTIVDYAGPWRTVEDWWSNTPLTRDDYDIMLDDGTLYRIAHREGGWILTRRLRLNYDTYGASIATGRNAASNCAITFGSTRSPAAFTFSSTCEGFVAPTITAEISLRRKHHASAS